jgi:hypothetical protein
MPFKNFTIFFSLISIACFAQIPMGNRTIGIHVTQAQNQQYDSAIVNFVKPPCIKVVDLFFTWKDIEPSPFTYSHTKTDTNLRIANFYYSPAYRDLPIDLQIAPINSSHKEVPTDLMGTTFDNITMIHRFEKMIDTVFSKLNNLQIHSLNIGNEHDAFIGSDTNKRNQYKTFYDSVKTYIKSTHPNLKIGTTFTFGGLTGSSSALYQAINQNSDIISLTYYGITSSYMAKPSNCPITDFAAITSLYPSTPIYIQECGYPSSTTCGSSDVQQAQFINNVFNTWDNLSTRIPYISFFQLTDWSQAAVDTFAVYYGNSTTVFKEFLRTLGLRTYAGMGTNKTAYDTLVSQASIRGACLTSAIDEKTIEPEINIFPNPCASSFTLRLDAISGPFKLYLYDISGKKILEKSGDINNGSLQTFDISFLASQLYICEIQIGRRSFFKKLSVQN